VVPYTPSTPEKQKGGGYQPGQDKKKKKKTFKVLILHQLTSAHLLIHLLLDRAAIALRSNLYMGVIAMARLAKVVRDKNHELSYSFIFLLSLACYLNSLSGELVHDDIFAVRDNQDLRSFTPIAQLLRDDFWGRGADA
jgi:hypothetical protein